jgi:hypothetical protein
LTIPRPQEIAAASCSRSPMLARRRRIQRHEGLDFARNAVGLHELRQLL